jgi:nucleoside-diphosphate-sugar epimerase
VRSYFITGGTGFIGRALVRSILNREDTTSVVCLTRGREDLIQHPKLTFWKGDITDVEFPEEDFTDLIHAAAEANDLLAPDQHRYYYTVVEGCRRILEWASERNIYRTLFVSSGCVGKGDSPYCRGKRISEWLTERHTNIKIARVYSVIGEELPLGGQYALGRFVSDAIFRGEVRYYESPSVRSYLHVDDVSQWLLTILDRGHPGTIYDVGASRPITVSDLAHMVAAYFEVPLKLIPAEHHPTAEIYLPDVTKAKDLGCRETVTLEKSIDRIQASYLCHPDLEQSETSQALH